jgi:hypothetical protein
LPYRVEVDGIVLADAWHAACGANAQKLAILLEMNSNTFLESASALQATIGVATLAACAKVDKSSARIATSR